MGRSIANKKARKGIVSQPGGTSNPANSVAQFVEDRLGTNAVSLTPKPGEPAYEELKQKLASLEKEAKQDPTNAIRFQVGNKGGVSVYGLGRFPVTLYYEQWVMLLDIAPSLRTFLEKERKAGKLKMKGDRA